MDIDVKAFLKVFLIFPISILYLGVPIIIGFLVKPNFDNLSQDVATFMIFSLVIYCLIFFILITKLGEWSAQKSAINDVSVNESELRQSIINLSANLPITVEQPKENTVLIRWDYTNEKYTHLFGAGMVKGGYELKLKLNSRRSKVYAHERHFNLSMNAQGLIRPSFNLGFKFFSGISLFESTYSTGYGFKIVDGKIVFDTLYDVRFTPGEIKGPIINLILHSGWDYAPKVFLR